MRLLAAIGAIALASAATAVAAPRPIMGARGPEDLEKIPGAPALIVSQLYATRDQAKGGLMLLDLPSGTVAPLAITPGLRTGWGDPACTTPPVHIGSHGIHLSRRRDGRLQLLVVNHDAREAIEFLEIDPRTRRATWRGCVTSVDAFNDVVAVPDGGFVASVPVVHGQPEKVDGTVAGFLVEWAPGRGFTRLRGSETAYTNGVQISPDARTVYVNAWTRREILRYDRAAQRVTARVKVGFMPDNLTFAADGSLLAAGIDALPGPDCLRVDGQCSVAFTVARVDPRTMRVTTIYHARPGEMAGASVAFQVGRDLYLGSYTGGRMLRLAMPPR